MSFGVMGGFMQPQGQVQVLSNIVDHGMDPQAALDAPRFSYEVAAADPATFHVEPYVGEGVLADLRARGHRIPDEPGYYGGGQVIRVDPDSGALVAGAEPRNDGIALAY
jgi:gamma-glutamyltranspeptidase/glutathione hydrolase